MSAPFQLPASGANLTFLSFSANLPQGTQQWPLHSRRSCQASGRDDGSLQVAFSSSRGPACLWRGRHNYRPPSPFPHFPRRVFIFRTTQSEPDVPPNRGQAKACPTHSTAEPTELRLLSGAVANAARTARPRCRCLVLPRHVDREAQSHAQVGPGAAWGLNPAGRARAPAAPSSGFCSWLPGSVPPLALAPPCPAPCPVATGASQPQTGLMIFISAFPGTDSALGLPLSNSQPRLSLGARP